jgi:antitoxin (DNA-binding transcriptional repressor) of toxin-antitoxin stability system
MTIISVEEARHDLAKLIERAIAGEDFLIEVAGQRRLHLGPEALTTLQSTQPAESPAAVRDMTTWTDEELSTEPVDKDDAIRRILEIQRRTRLPPGVTVRQLIEEERRF